jgi:hypothetical protein
MVKGRWSDPAPYFLMLALQRLHLIYKLPPKDIDSSDHV